ncbi:uncharacterized protein [Aegilops tauschii subsp. strangulata]|uniref:uncharacterized protein n=1 Tax=Triticum aestivum TaxID=4565 RepID=UPI001D02D352|nr:uncharacterized protein LOC123048359 [Triticum aestivum]XP_044327414.1 uncharacterized protein LOC123048362 [Triticum aestivum]XP_044327415.1 uncharacterized protein LOC123048363 [Triticum aestivum]XP_045089671.1 uncharacterized protein LOC120974363 [Aegilops tauschii subsp. strangulata]
MAESAGGGEPRLPEELVLWEILTRLPARSLLRCRAVCTSWRRSLTSDTGLLLAHHRHQPALQLVTTGDDLEGRIDALDPRAGERRPVARTDRAASPMDLVLLAACYIGMARYNPTLTVTSINVVLIDMISESHLHRRFLFRKISVPAFHLIF